MKTLAVMLLLSPWHGDQGDENRGSLLQPLAIAIDNIGHTREERAALIADAYAESSLARYVLEGRCSDGPPGQRCDPDQHGVARARGPWQVWHYCHKPGLEGEAECVVQLLRLGKHRCASWEGAFAALHGPSCQWAPATQRVQLMRRLLPMLD
jgi:hypothetical protein